MTSLSRQPAPPSTSPFKVILKLPIENFTHTTSQEYCRWSSIVCLPVDESVRLRLWMYPLADGAQSSKISTFSLNLVYYGQLQMNLTTTCRLAILTGKGIKSNERVRTTTVKPRSHQSANLFSIVHQFIFNREQFIRDAQLKTAANVTFQCEVQGQLTPPKEALYSAALLQISSNNECFLYSGKFADVTFKIGHSEVRAHRVIVAAQSSVLAAMIGDEDQAVVKLEGIRLEVFQEMLRFIYCGGIHDLSRSAEELYEAAYKYQVNCLKAICAQYLATNLNVNSAIYILLLAEFHQDSELKVACSTFISQRKGEVLAAEERKQLMLTKGMKMLKKLDGKVESPVNSTSEEIKGEMEVENVVERVLRRSASNWSKRLVPKKLPKTLTTWKGKLAKLLELDE